MFADGRAALYDANAIAAATDAAPIQPRATLGLATRGEPRTISVSGKSSPTLWIGTSSGEVVSVSVVRKSAG